MKISSLHVFYYSFSGGTRKVVHEFARGAALPTKLYNTLKNPPDPKACFLKDDDLTLIAVPSYGGRVPAIALERIKRMHGLKTPCVILTTYSGRGYDDTLAELRDTLIPNGFKIIGAAAVISRHSILRELSAERPNVEDRTQIRKFGQDIKSRLLECSNVDQLATPDIPGGPAPYRKPKAMIIPYGTKDCDNCGYCVKRCPRKAIPFDNAKRTLATECVACMRCVYECPRHARVPKITFANRNANTVDSSNMSCEFFLG